MKNHLKYFFCVCLFGHLLTGCINYRKLITEEVVLKDGNSQTGTIVQCDSTNLKIKKIDESISIIPWIAIDTISGKKLKTIWYGTNVGYYNIPYFSVFRNESIIAKQMGIQYKIGLAIRGNKLGYLNFLFAPAKPYAITKFGFGYQRYLGDSGYQKNNSFFVGSELNFMNAKYNNGSQLTLEPYTGFEKRYHEHLRLHFKFGLQFNIANKNNQVGFNTTIGVHFMRRNFKKQYEILNKEHRMY